MEEHGPEHPEAGPSGEPVVVPGSAEVGTDTTESDPGYEAQGSADAPPDTVSVTPEATPDLDPVHDAPAPARPDDRPAQDARTGEADAATSTPESPDLTALRVLESHLEQLRQDFDRRATEYEKTIRALHSSLEDLQGQQLTGMMKPVFQLFADLQAELASAAARARESGDEMYAGEFEFFAGSVDAVLEHFDLESVRAAEGDVFDRRAHAAVLSKVTEDPELDQTVARVARQGFRVVGESRVLLPARVVVWRHRPAESSPSSEASADAPGESTPPP